MYPILGKSGPVLLVVLGLIPLFWWAPSSSWSFLSIGRIAGITGSVLLALNFLLSARIRFFEHFFSGLNRMYIIHALLGSISFLLLIIHPLFMLLSRYQLSLESAISLITPSLDNIPILLGSAAFGLMSVLMIFSIYIKIAYHSWKSLHQWFGLVLILAALHATQIGSTIAANPGLRMYLITIYSLGLAAFLYKKLSSFIGANRYNYQVDKAVVTDHITQITLRALTKRLHFIPGQFAFFKVYAKGITTESHPFSLASSPDDKVLRIAAKSVGDYTETLKLLTKRAQVEVEGPFGRFSYEYDRNTKQVWIAGGIGITPFLSMAASLPVDAGFDVTLIYSTKNINEAVFDQELSKFSKQPGFTYILYESETHGRLTGKYIDSVVNGLEAASCFICGPVAMMKSLRDQLVAIGVKPGRIHTEQFSLD